MLPVQAGLDFRRLYGDEMPEDAIDLIKQMLVLDPIKRATAKEALSHPFFLDIREKFEPSIDHEHLPAVDNHETNNAYNDLNLEELKNRIEVELSMFHRRG